MRSEVLNWLDLTKTIEPLLVPTHKAKPQFIDLYVDDEAYLCRFAYVTSRRAHVAIAAHRLWSFLCLQEKHFNTVEYLYSFQWYAGCF